MDSNKNLTVINIPNNLSNNDNGKLQLEENYYKKLFIEEMNFRKNPTQLGIKNIIQKHCHAVEYFSSIGDNNRAMRYKLLNNIFLNDSQVIRTLDHEKIKNSGLGTNLIKNILILNKKKNSEEYNKIKDDFDDIKGKYNFLFFNEQEKIDELIRKKNELEKNIESNNLIEDEINIQKNNFKRNLTLKLQKKKTSNENKILQGIQQVFINEKNINNKNKNEIQEDVDMNIINHIQNSNEIKLEKKISPIKFDQNYSDKDTSSSNNDLKFSSNEKNSNNLLSSSNNKKSPSQFEPLTPYNNDKSEKVNEFKSKSSAKQDKSINSEEVNETNDFSLANNDENINKKESVLNNEISLNETNYSNNSKSLLSNLSPSNNTNSINLNESNNNSILKSFRLDFNDLFDYIKEHKNSNKKAISFCNDIKIIIENYINEYNQYLSKNVIEKIIKRFSEIFDEMFDEYKKIAESFDKEIKNIDFENINKNKSNITELSNLIDNINNEKENALNQNEEKFLNEIEKNEIYFKTNYNKIDNGILLLNEKFEFNIIKRICDMFNNFSK